MGAFGNSSNDERKPARRLTEKRMPDTTKVLKLL
jgi:hypothetical protein